MTDVNAKRTAARELIAGAARIVGFTGAGISTESGVPDFRSPDGVWARNRTVYFQEFVSSEADRVEYWRQKVEGWPAMRAARPNAGHYAFVALHEQGKLTALITQNIERLHQRSGLPANLVLELHGTTTEAVCLTCGDRIPSDEACRRVAGGERAPRCALCGGLLKPATVSFGQAMPHDVMVRSQAAAESCDLLLAVGSSLVVRAGRVDSASRQARRRATGHRQPRADPAGRPRRRGPARRNRRHPARTRAAPMPELPEVETVRRTLAPSLEGRTITAVTFCWPRTCLGDPGETEARLAGQRIERLDRHGKYPVAPPPQGRPAVAAGHPLADDREPAAER